MGRKPNRPVETKPIFVKILFRGFSEKLLIPPKYVRLHNQTLAKECVLRPTHTLVSWPVRTKHIDNHLYFKKGWEEFAKHHSLQFGDLLIFRHVQNSEFDVDVVDMSCTPKEHVPSGYSKDSARVPPVREKKTILKTAAVTQAEAFISSSEFPSFKKIMQPIYVKPGGYLYVPKDYAQEYMKDINSTVKIELSDKAWIVSVHQEYASGARFCSGWSDLARQNNLRVGDVCVFQLIRDNTLKLTIFWHTRAVTFENVPSMRNTAPVLPSKEKIVYPKTPALIAAEEFMANSHFPTFDRVMQSAYVRSGGYMPLPPDFAIMHMKYCTEEVKIEFLDQIWTLKILKNGRASRLSSSWSRLATKNSLKVGDVCVFQLINTRDYTLKLSVFSNTREENRTFQVTTRSSTPSFTDSDCDNDSESDSESDSDSDNALEAANKFSSLSKHPWYLSIMNLSYLQGGYLHVPLNFVKKLNARESAKKVKLRCSGKEWDAIINIHGYSGKINKGWPPFVKENSLHEGDACVFELINREDAVIRVSIFKCTN